MSLAQKMHFLQDVFQITAIALVSVINYYPIKGLHLFWDTGYLGSYITSAESHVKIRFGKAWTAVNRLSILWKSYLPDKIEQEFFQVVAVSVLLYNCTAWTLTKLSKKKRNN